MLSGWPQSPWPASARVALASNIKAQIINVGRGASFAYLIGLQAEQNRDHAFGAWRQRAAATARRRIGNAVMPDIVEELHETGELEQRLDRRLGDGWRGSAAEQVVDVVEGESPFRVVT